MAAGIGLMSKKRLGVGAIALGLALATIVVAVELSGSGRTRTPPEAPSSAGSSSQEKVQQGISPELRDLMAIFDGTQPLFPAGVETTLADASSAAGFPVYTPKGLADLAPEVWLSEGSREVGLRYDSELVLLEVSWPGGQDPAGTYAQQAKQWRAGYVTTISGHPAWVIPAGSRAPGQPPVNVVHVTIDGVDVTLYGRTKIDDLVSVAETLQA